MSESKANKWISFVVRLGSSRLRRQMWGNLTEVVFGLTLVLAGTMLLAWTLAVVFRLDQALGMWPGNPLITAEPLGVPQIVLRIAVASCLLLTGFFQLLPMVLASTASEERRGSVFRKALETAELEGAVPNQKYPKVGHLAGVTKNASGRFTIPISKRSRLRLFFWVFLAVLLFSAAAVSGQIAWAAWDNSDFWRFTLILLICASLIGLGVFGAVQAGKRVLFQTQYGWSLLELRDYPIRIGQANHFYLKQTGDVVLKRLSITLECWEEATYRQGTDISTDRKRVFEKEIFVQEKVRLGMKPLQIDGNFLIPPEQMHSFYGNNNSVSWSFCLQGQVKRSEPLKRRFPVIVLPSGESNSVGTEIPQMV